MLLLLSLALFFGPLLVLVGRRRWAAEAAKQEEVRRLALLAAEEVARAGLECSAGASYACDLGESRAGGETKKVRRQRRCAVCCSPTTTRCSRCKAVRYWCDSCLYSSILGFFCGEIIIMLKKKNLFFLVC